MEFTLIYEGHLKANGSVNDKLVLRRAFHKQLKTLLKQPPFACDEDSGFVTYKPVTDFHPSTHHKISDFNFIPFVSTGLKAIAELDILMLRPEHPGSLVTQGGDIDNRLKTLLDSLRTPKDIKEIPKNSSPSDEEQPFYCLLEDDSLITKLSISADRLLIPNKDPSHVVLAIRVKTKVLMVTCDNIDLA